MRCGNSYLAKKVTEEKMRLAVALVPAVVSLLLFVDARALAQVLRAIADEHGFLNATRQHTWVQSLKHE